MQVSVLRHRAAATLTSVALLGLVCAGAASAATAKSSVARFPFCSWWFETTPQSANVALPDTSAAYWTTPFFATPGLKIYVKGQFPDARFMSVIVYNNSGGTFTRNGVSSGLVDYQIKPDTGTKNPFQQATHRLGRFTLTIRRDVSPSQSNVLPLVPTTPTKGNLLPPGLRLHHLPGVSAAQRQLQFGKAAHACLLPSREQPDAADVLGQSQGEAAGACAAIPNLEERGQHAEVPCPVRSAGIREANGGDDQLAVP